MKLGAAQINGWTLQRKPLNLHVMLVTALYMVICKQREIFSALGRNFSIKDRKLKIEANEWFVPIEKAYPVLESEYNRLELNKNLSVEARNEARAQLILTWGAVVGEVRTGFEVKNDVSVHIQTFYPTHECIV